MALNVLDGGRVLGGDGGDVAATAGLPVSYK